MCTDDEITFDEVIHNLGPDIADQAVTFGLHHSDADNKPVWRTGDIDRILELIAIEKRRDQGGTI